MAAELKSTALGMVTGVIAFIKIEDLITAAVVALLTGACSYIGHTLLKHVHTRYFKTKKK
jgi:hypothetical protein